MISQEMTGKGCDKYSEKWRECIGKIPEVYLYWPALAIH